MCSRKITRQRYGTQSFQKSNMGHQLNLTPPWTLGRHSHRSRGWHCHSNHSTGASRDPALDRGGLNLNGPKKGRKNEWQVRPIKHGVECEGMCAIVQQTSQERSQNLFHASLLQSESALWKDVPFLALQSELELLPFLTKIGHSYASSIYLFHCIQSQCVTVSCLQAREKMDKFSLKYSSCLATKMRTGQRVFISFCLSYHLCNCYHLRDLQIYC